MEELEAAGWKKAEEKKQEEITEEDIRSIFNIVDMDKSGSVSKRVINLFSNIGNVCMIRKLVWHANFSRKDLELKM